MGSLSFAKFVSIFTFISLREVSFYLFMFANELCFSVAILLLKFESRGETLFAVLVGETLSLSSLVETASFSCRFTRCFTVLLSFMLSAVVSEADCIPWFCLLSWAAFSLDVHSMTYSISVIENPIWFILIYISDFVSSFLSKN